MSLYCTCFIGSGLYSLKCDDALKTVFVEKYADLFTYLHDRLRRRPNVSASPIVSGSTWPSVSGRHMYSRPDTAANTPNTRDGNGFHKNAYDVTDIVKVSISYW